MFGRSVMFTDGQVFDVVDWKPVDVDTSAGPADVDSETVPDESVDS